MKLSNQARYLFFILIVLLPLAIASEEGSTIPPPSQLPPELPTYDQFLNNPTPNQFNQLTPEDQAKFFQDPLNVDKYPAIAAQYFGNPQNVGLGRTALAEQRFFASENNVRAYLDSAEKHFSLPGNIDKNKETAGLFLQQKYQATFKIVGEGLAYEQETKTLRYGSKVISLGEYSGKDSIEASGNCFKINAKSICGEVSTISFNRDEQNNQQSFEFKNNEGTQQARAVVQSDETASLSFDSSSKLIVQGKIQGEITVGKEQIKYTNKDQDGSLEIWSTGEIKADNAEVITTKVYLDGRFQRTLTGEGKFDYSIYSFNGQDTVLIDKNSKVGVRSQGQSQQLGEQVLVHLDSTAERSRYAQQKPREEQSPDELLKQARELRSSPAKTGNNGEVWIKKKATETLVYAEGKVDVGFYDGGRIPGRLPIENKPHFNGKSAGALFDYRLEGSGESLSLAGQVEYSDSQYEKVTTTQDGATLNVQRQFNRPDDVLIADCKSCPASADPVITVGKRVAVSDRSTLGILSANRVDVSVYQTEKGLEYRLPTSGLGSLAETQVDGLVGQAGRTLLMEIPCTTGEQCRLLFGKDQRGFFRGYYEAVDAQGQKRQQNLPLSIRAAIGKEIVVTSEKNREATQQLLQLLQEKKIAEISSVQFTADPALRKLLQRELGIDIDLISNPAYVSGLTHSAEKRGEFEVLRQKIREEFGIEINEQGSCLGKKDCAKITQALVEATPLGSVYNAMRTKLVQSRLEAVKAQMETGASKQELRKLSQDDQKQLRNLVKAQEGMETVRQQQQTARQLKAAMAAPLTDEQQADLDDASRVGQHKKEQLRDLEIQKQRKTELQAQLGKYEEDIKERKSEERSYAHIVDNVRQAQQSLTEVEARIKAAQGEIGTAEAFLQDRIATYNADRPDLAARIAVKAGDADVAREISKTIEAISPDQAKLIVVEAELQEGNLKKAVEKAGEIERASSFAQADALLYDHVKQTLEERHREQSEAVAAKADDIKEKMSGLSGFFSFMTNKAMAVGAITGDFVENALRGELGTDESYAFYEQQRRDAGERAWQQLRQNAGGTAQLLQQLEMAQEEGLPVQDAFRQMATSTDPTIASAASQPVLRALKEQVFAREPDEELAAEVLMQKARETIQFHDGKTAYGEMELRSICWEHPWTAACQQSDAMLKELERSPNILSLSNKNLDLYGDTAMDFAADVTNLIPFVSAFRLVSGAEKGWKAARMIGAAEGVAKVAQTASVGVEAGRASKILSSVVNTVMNPKVWLTPTGRELTSAITQAKKELQVAQVAADAEQVLAAGQDLDRAQRALNAYKTVQGVPTLTMREFSVVSTENQAFKEMRALAKGYDAAVASRGVLSDEAIKIGEQIGAAAERAEQASWSAGLGRWMGTKLAGEATVARQAGEVAKATTLTQYARRAEQLLQDLDAKGVHIVVEPETKSLRYDVQHLPPAEQKEAMDAVTEFTALQRKHGLGEQEIFDGFQKVIVDTAQLFDRNPTKQAATAILDDLRRQQATGASTGVLPDVISSAGKDRAMAVGEIIPSPQQVEAEAELLSTTPSTPSLEQLVLRYEQAGGTPTEINRLQQAVQERSLTIARGELARARELDYAIINAVVRDPVTGMYSGSGTIDAYVNGLIGSGAAVNSRKVFYGGGDFILTWSKKSGETSLIRGDLNFLSEVRKTQGVSTAETVQKQLNTVISDIMDDLNAGRIADDDATIGQEITRRFSDAMREREITVTAEIGDRVLEVQPSLSLGIVHANPTVTQAIRQGEKNGAALLRTMAEKAVEEQRKSTLNQLLQLGEEALPGGAAKVVTVTENEVAAASKLVPQETDDLVGQVIANEGKVKLDGNYQVVKPEPGLEARVEKAVTGLSREREIPVPTAVPEVTPPRSLQQQFVKKQRVVEDFKRFKELNQKYARHGSIDPKTRQIILLSDPELDELAQLEKTFIGSEKELNKYIRLTSIINPTSEQLKAFKKFEDNLLFQLGMKHTDATEHFTLIREYFGTGQLGKVHPERLQGTAAEIGRGLRQNADEVMGTYRQGFRAQRTGQTIRTTESQDRLLRVMVDNEARLIEEALQNGEMTAIAAQRGLPVEEVIREFNDGLMDGIQRMVLYDGVVMSEMEGTFRIGAGIVRLRESNGLDHIVGNQLRALELMQASELRALTPLQKLEVMEAMRYHDYAKGSLWNNAGKMTEVGLVGELGESHVAASAKFIDADRARLVRKYGEDGVSRIKYLANHHDHSNYWLARKGEEGVRDLQYNAMTLADNMAGVQIRAADGHVISDKLIEAIEVIPGNQEILSKALNLDEGIGLSGLTGSAKQKFLTEAIEALREQAIQNINKALAEGKITPEFAEAARQAFHDDFGPFSARSMRRTQTTGVTSARFEEGMVIVEHRSSAAADTIEQLHPGMRYDSMRKTTDPYWDRVIIKPREAGADEVSRTFDLTASDSVVHEVLSDGSIVDLIDESGARVTVENFKKQWLKKVTGNKGKYKLDKTQKYLDNPTQKGKAAQDWLDPQTGEKRVGLEHRFLDETTPASPAQQLFAEAALGNTQIKEKIIRTQERGDEIIAAIRGDQNLDLSSEEVILNINEKFQEAGYDLRIDPQILKGLSPEEAIQKLEALRDSFIRRQWENYFHIDVYRVGQQAPLQLGDGTLRQLITTSTLEEIVRRSTALRHGAAETVPELRRAVLDTSDRRAFVKSIERHYEAELGLPEGSLSIKLPETLPSSGNEVFIAKYTSPTGEQRALAVKVFIRDSRVPGEEAMREVEALEVLREKGLHVPAVVDVVQTNYPGKDNVIMIATEIAPGQDLAGRIRTLSQLPPQSLERSAALDDLVDDLSLVGKELTRYHRSVPASPLVDLSRDIQTVQQQLTELRETGRLEERLYRAAISDLEQDIVVLRQTGVSGRLVHGDFHAGNVFVDSHSRVTFIDVESTLWSIGSDGKTVGNAAQDYGRFLDNIEHRGEVLGFQPEEIQRLQDAFLQSYLPGSGLSPEEIAATEYLYSLRPSLAWITSPGQEGEIALQRVKRIIERRAARSQAAETMVNEELVNPTLTLSAEAFAASP